MGRRSLARRLNKETRGHRHEKLNIEEWLSRPQQKVTRGEVYVLLRQWHYEVYRDTTMRRSYVERVFHIIFLIGTAPIRILWRFIVRRRAKWQNVDDRVHPTEGGKRAAGESEVVQ